MTKHRGEDGMKAGEYKKLGIVITAYFEIRDADIYGGRGSTGYTSVKVEGDGRMTDEDLDMFLANQISMISILLKISEENISVITQGDYEDAMQDEDE